MYVRRCLIERLVYDRIYEANLRMQDLGHKFELEQVYRIYDTYFPNRSLKVASLGFTNESYPDFLKIKTYYKDEVIEEETYQKNIAGGVYDNDNIRCTKVNHVGKKKYEKYQGFDAQEEWVELI